jgi:hypothetical protein
MDNSLKTCVHNIIDKYIDNQLFDNQLFDKIWEENSLNFMLEVLKESKNNKLQNKDNKDTDWKKTKSNGNLKDQVYEMVNQYLEVIDIDIDCEIFEKLWDQQLSEFILIISSEVKTKKYVDLKERLEKIRKID